MRVSFRMHIIGDPNPVLRTVGVVRTAATGALVGSCGVDQDQDQGQGSVASLL